MEEYVVVNKAVLIAWVKEESKGLTSNTIAGMFYALQEVLAQGKPLQPIVEDALTEGIAYYQDSRRWEEAINSVINKI